MLSLLAQFLAPLDELIKAHILRSGTYRRPFKNLDGGDRVTHTLLPGGTAVIWGGVLVADLAIELIVVASLNLGENVLALVLKARGHGAGTFH